MAASFAGPSFQALGLEMWNGTLAQTNSFVSVTGITYPALYGGSTAIANSYNTGYDVFFVVGGEGLISFRRSGWSLAQTTAAVSAALAALTSDVPPLVRDGFFLKPAYPNPFNPSTSLVYRIGGGGDQHVRLRILDVQGRALRMLVDERQGADRDYTITWDGRDDAGLTLASGSYLVELAIGGKSQSRFVTLLK
jgi:hypothetical protein